MYNLAIFGTYFQRTVIRTKFRSKDRFVLIFDYLFCKRVLAPVDT